MTKQQFKTVWNSHDFKALEWYLRPLLCPVAVIDCLMCALGFHSWSLGRCVWCGKDKWIQEQEEERK